MFKEGQGLLLIQGVYLNNGLRLSPDVMLVHHTRCLIQGIDVYEQLVAVHLEHVVECSRGHVGQCKKGLTLCQIRGIGRQDLTDGNAKISLPLLTLNGHKYLTGLAANVWKKGALLVILAACKCKDCKS